MGNVSRCCGFSVFSAKVVSESMYLGDISDGDVREFIRKFAKKLKRLPLKVSAKVRSLELRGGNYCNLLRRGRGYRAVAYHG